MDRQFYATLDSVQERHWWYVARRKILDGVLQRVSAAGLPAGTLYDLGCGVGANLPVLQKFGPTVGVDMSEDAVAFCHERGHANVVRADLDHLEGLADGSGSVVVLADVIEHLDDERPCLRAVQRALAPGGALVVTVPAYQFLWSPADDLSHHRRRYTATQLRQVIEPLFEVEYVSYFNTLLFGLVAAGRAVERVLQRGGDDMAHVPKEPLNGLLSTIFATESHLLPKVNLPFGVSILCVARKR